MPFTRLTSEDGLGNNSVQCILQGRDGIMWIGTNGGLNRYDGAAFIQYNILSKPALSSNVITALLEDDAGNIWIGTDNGLDILNPVANTIRQFSHSACLQLPFTDQCDDVGYCPDRIMDGRRRQDKCAAAGHRGRHQYRQHPGQQAAVG